MQTYQLQISYGGYTITTQVLVNTGTIQVPGQNGIPTSENTHSIRMAFDDQDSIVPGIRQADVLPRIEQMLVEAKAYIDGVVNTYLNGQLQDAGFELLPGLAAPANFVVSNATNNSIQVDWDAVAGADRYVVELSTLPDFSFIYITSSPTTDSPYTFTPLSADHTYYIRVQAYSDADGYSDYAYLEASTQP